MILPGPTSGFHCVYEFQSQGFGWQMHWWNTAGDLESAIAIAAGAGDNLRSSLAAPTFLERVRVLSVTQRNVAGVYAWKPPPEADPPKFAAVPWSALRVQAISGGNFSRSFWMRGINFRWISYDQFGQPAPAAGAFAPMKAILNGFSIRGFGWWALTRGGANAPQNIQAIGTDTSGRLSVQVTNGAAFLPGYRVTVSGAQGTGLKEPRPGRQGVNGVHQVYSVNGNFLSLNFLTSILPPGWTYTDSGTVRNRYVQFARVDPIGAGDPGLWISEKRPGKVISSAPGRAKVKVRQTVR